MPSPQDASRELKRAVKGARAGGTLGLFVIAATAMMGLGYEQWCANEPTRVAIRAVIFLTFFMGLGFLFLSFSAMDNRVAAIQFRLRELSSKIDRSNETERPGDVT
jgi:hypothetical protein